MLPGTASGAAHLFATPSSYTFPAAVDAMKSAAVYRHSDNGKGKGKDEGKGKEVKGKGKGEGKGAGQR
jgi:hypothetical protein